MWSEWQFVHFKKRVKTPQDIIPTQLPPGTPSYYVLRGPHPLIKVIKLSWVSYHVVELRSVNEPFSYCLLASGIPSNGLWQTAARKIVRCRTYERYSIGFSEGFQRRKDILTKKESFGIPRAQYWRFFGHHWAGKRERGRDGILEFV